MATALSPDTLEPSEDFENLDISKIKPWKKRGIGSQRIPSGVQKILRVGAILLTAFNPFSQPQSSVTHNSSLNSEVDFNTAMYLKNQEDKKEEKKLEVAAKPSK